jgi:hypothetical protein
MITGFAFCDGKHFPDGRKRGNLIYGERINVFSAAQDGFLLADL